MPEGTFAGNDERGAEQLLAEEVDLAGLAIVEALVLLAPDQGILERRDLADREPGGVDRLELEVLGADLEPGQHVRPRDLIQRTGAGDGVVAGHLAKPQVVAIDPDARDPRLAPHHLILARPMHGHHDVAAALGGAEQDHVGADERRGDRDQMVRQVRDQGLRPGGGAARQDGERQDHEQAGEASGGCRHHEWATGPRE